MAVNRITLSHSKSFGMGKTLVVGPIYKELLGKETAIDKLARITFEQASMIKEQEAMIEVFQREAEEEEQTGLFDMKA